MAVGPIKIRSHTQSHLWKVPVENDAHPPSKISGKLDYVAEFLIAGEGPAPSNE